MINKYDYYRVDDVEFQRRHNISKEEYIRIEKAKEDQAEFRKIENQIRSVRSNIANYEVAVNANLMSEADLDNEYSKLGALIERQASLENKSEIEKGSEEVAHERETLTEKQTKVEEPDTDRQLEGWMDYMFEEATPEEKEGEANDLSKEEN